MNNLYVFLNTSVENSGALAWIGDQAFAPFRYMFDGKKILIQLRDSDQKIEIHNVADFHKHGKINRSRTNINLNSSSTGMVKTAISVVFLFPGLVLGTIFKGLAYLFSDVREKHYLTKEHLTPVDREIGNKSNPIITIEELEEALRAERKADPKNRPTNALIIHGNGDLAINEDPGIFDFNPMKLILEGGYIVRMPGYQRLADNMRDSSKWQIIDSTPSLDASERTSDGGDPGTSLPKSVDEALKFIAPKRNRTFCKQYHVAFFLPIGT